jgi:hypothetical protein
MTKTIGRPSVQLWFTFCTSVELETTDLGVRHFEDQVAVYSHKIEKGGLQIELIEGCYPASVIIPRSLHLTGANERRKVGKIQLETAECTWSKRYETPHHAVKKQ